PDPGQGERSQCRWSPHPPGSPRSDRVDWQQLHSACDLLPTVPRPRPTDPVTPLAVTATYHAGVNMGQAIGTEASPYALELQRGVRHLRFAAPLESQYTQERLSEGRLLIRVACMLSALVSLLRAADTVYAGTWDVASLTDLAIVTGISLTLAWLAWSTLYERL